MAFLTEFERKLDIPPAEKKQVMREMESHYEEIVEELTASGMDAAAAEQEAARRLGDPQDVASRLGTVHCRATWRTALLMVLPFLLALFVHWHDAFISYGLNSHTARQFVSDPNYVYAQVVSLVVLSLLSMLMVAGSAREFGRGRRPMWLAVWMGVGLWSVISIPWLAVLIIDDGTKLGMVRLVAASETLALGIGAAWLSSKWRTALGAGALIAALAVAWMPWAPSNLLVDMLLQAPFIMFIARRVFGGHPYGNNAQTSLFLFAFYAANLSYMIAKAPTGVPVVPLLMSVVVVAILLIYARASTWGTKTLALAIGIEIVGLLSAGWGDIPMSHYSVSSGPGFDPQWGVLLTFLLCWVILVPMLLSRRESQPAITRKQDKQMRHRRWGRGALITLGVIVAINFIAGIVIDRKFFRTSIGDSTSPSIVRHPPAADYSGMHGKMTSIPTYDPSKSESGWQMDLRSTDLSSADVTGKEKDLLHADFDSKTKWPAGVKNLPSFKPDRIMELGKNPGLGVRSLHKQGITGKGVAIAIIDQCLLADHEEYKDRLRMYEEIHNTDYSSAMHGAAVASIAVGKTVGVAPGADLYFIAETHIKGTPLGFASLSIPGAGMFAAMDFGPLARSINRIVDINQRLPKDRKIRVISLSIGWSAWQQGSWAADRALRRAEKDGIFVITTGLRRTSGGEMEFMGLGREPLLDPDKPGSYGPGSFWESFFFDSSDRLSEAQRTKMTTGRLLVPMDSRCTASPTGENDYVFYRNGGLSWSVPYVAGLYALACQVKPDVTPEEFWKTALDTSDTVRIKKDGKEYSLRYVVNPTRLINQLTETTR